ncbi:hypothetical protein APSETT445_002408 [Aspergillus pseudonomiae]
MEPEKSADGELSPEAPRSLINERKLMAKIDWHVVPCLCLMYLLAFLDRVNISNAAILGLQEDLNIETGTKYNTALTIFFVPYIIFEIPSNILMKKLKPHLWCFYLMGMWYKRSEAQKRFSFFFSSTTLAGAFGGLLASGLGKMEGLRGYRGWRWVFIIEGVLTCVVAIICYFLVTDFPEDAKWLTEEEREFVREKLAADTGKAAPDAKLSLRDVLGVFKDYKIFIGGWMYFGQVVTAYGYAYFAPTIIKTYGYGPIKTQLYSIPPWAAAFGFSMVVAFLSDRFRHRFAFAFIPMLIAMAGYGILLNIHGEAQRHVQYGALFLVTMGCYSAMPVLVCWFSMNLGGHRRRSVGTAWQIGFGNIGGIISTYSFLQKDAPLYRNGYIISLSFLCFSAAMAVVYFVALWFDNRKRDRAMANGAVDSATEEQEEQEGDMALTYRYNY